MKWPIRPASSSSLFGEERSGPPVPMESHDALFKRAFSVPAHAAGELRSVLPPRVLEHLNLEALEPLPGSFVDAAFKKRHTDLLFRAPFADKQAYFYFLLEHQSEPDVDMPWRMLRYVVRIWEKILRDEPSRRSLPVLIPMILHHGKHGWTAPRFLHELIEGLDTFPELHPFVPNFELLIDDLVTVDDEHLQTRPLSSFPKVALWVLRDGRSLDALVEHLHHWGPELEQLAQGDVEDIESILRYVFQVAGESPFETIRKRILEVAPATEEPMASIAEQLIQQGVQKGMQQGVQKGMQQGVRKGMQQGVRKGMQQGVQKGMQQTLQMNLKRLLEKHFGSLPEDIRDRIQAADTDTLDQWFERAIENPSLDAIFNPDE